MCKATCIITLSKDGSKLEITIPEIPFDNTAFGIVKNAVQGHEGYKIDSIKFRREV